VGALLIQDTLGFVPDLGAITEAVGHMGLPIIEDCSLSCGTARSAPFGLSFVIMGLEERDLLTAGGGALLFAVNKKEGAALKNAGPLPPEYGLPDMNAALAIVQFRELAKNLARRKELAEAYTQASLQTRHKRFIALEDAPYNNYAFPLVLETGMKDVKAYARKKDIEVESAFAASLVALQEELGEQCPVSASLALRTALFPLHPRLSAGDATRIAKVIGTLP
jgi:dTDP-4-amino-4,6-dideoxygalactose transaminase